MRLPQQNIEILFKSAIINVLRDKNLMYAPEPSSLSLNDVHNNLF